MTLAELRREIAATKARLAALTELVPPAMARRDRAIVAAFDAGETAKETAFRLGETLSAVTGVLARNDRRVFKRKIPLSHLPTHQQRHYRKLRITGIPPKSARAIAQAIEPRTVATIPVFLAAVSQRPALAPQRAGRTLFALTSAHKQRLPTGGDVVGAGAVGKPERASEFPGARA